MDIRAYCEAAALLSSIAVEFADRIVEVDINPVKVLERGCMGLDALIIHKTERFNKDKMAV